MSLLCFALLSACASCIAFVDNSSKVPPIVCLFSNFLILLFFSSLRCFINEVAPDCSTLRPSSWHRCYLEAKSLSIMVPDGSLVAFFAPILLYPRFFANYCPYSRSSLLSFLLYNSDSSICLLIVSWVPLDHIYLRDFTRVSCLSVVRQRVINYFLSTFLSAAYSLIRRAYCSLICS